MAFSVVADTASNLPLKTVKEKNIYVLPLTYRMGGKDLICTDIENFDGVTFYNALRDGEVITTSQVTPDNYMEVFEPILRDGLDIICTCMASGISGTYNSANIAAGMLLEKYPERRISVIDTKGAALGEGFIAMRAAELRDIGMEFDEAVKELESYVQRMCNVFTVDDLMFLKRGGRLSNLSSIVGTVLNIKPLLKGSNEAKIVCFHKLRGRKKSIEALAERYATLVKHPEDQVIGIVNAACREDAEKLIEMINATGKSPKGIMSVDYEPVTGCHVGPGALALFFEGDDNVREEIDNMTGIIKSLRDKVGI